MAGLSQYTDTHGYKEACLDGYGLRGFYNTRVARAPVVGEGQPQGTGWGGGCVREGRGGDGDVAKGHVGGLLQSKRHMSSELDRQDNRKSFLPQAHRSHESTGHPQPLLSPP